MSSTHLSLHYHVVFSTKLRTPWIHSSWRARMHDYLGGCIKTAGGAPDTIGGIHDHVHILMELRATHCLADVMRDIKRASSAWVHQDIGVREFGWQDGYGAFTVSRDHRTELKRYIATQEEHHQNRGFQMEYVKLLEDNEVPYDERYLW